MQNSMTAVCISSLPPFIFEKWMPLFFFSKSLSPKRGIKRRSMKVARKVAVAFCISSLLSSCSALQEILQSSLRIPHHFIKTWLEMGGGGGEGEDRLIHMWFEVFFFDNLSEVFKNEKAALRTLCGGVDIMQSRRNRRKLGRMWQCAESLFVTEGGVSTCIVHCLQEFYVAADWYALFSIPWGHMT